MKLPRLGLGAAHAPAGAQGWRGGPGGGAGVRPQTNGDGEKVDLPPNTTLRPDRSRYKQDEVVESGMVMQTNKLTCPCLTPDGQQVNGIKYVTFVKALETKRTLLCPTQQIVCDPSRAPVGGGVYDYCVTTDRSARVKDFDSVEKP